MRGGIWASLVVCAGTALWSACIAEAASKAKPRISAATLKHAIESKSGSLQLITFPDTAWSAVRVVRGGSPARDKTGQQPATEKTETAEIVTFADPRKSPVRVLRGDNERGLVTSGPVRPAAAMTMQVVTFANLRDGPVSILRGAGVPAATETELFGPASAADLDRVAFAVDGAESSHGADLRMWRPEAGGPQGPMQVSAAAAFDVGGGDRFSLAENRALGRAYLARMYRRYGNWQDAIAAYNWGPGNLDAWIGGGRATDKLPLAVERYRNRVLREAVLAEPGITMASRWALGNTPTPEPPDRPPVPASVAAAFVADALQRGAAAGNAALRQFAAALHNRAADWKSAYERLAGRIVSLARRPSTTTPDLDSEYAAASGPAD
jgi:Transglycosylase SLT domain